jgi:hypothetical protein
LGATGSASDFMELWTAMSFGWGYTSLHATCEAGTAKRAFYPQESRMEKTLAKPVAPELQNMFLASKHEL